DTPSNGLALPPFRLEDRTLGHAELGPGRQGLPPADAIHDASTGGDTPEGGGIAAEPLGDPCQLQEQTALGHRIEPKEPASVPESRLRLRELAEQLAAVA